jgi:hypothetical protein
LMSGCGSAFGMTGGERGWPRRLSQGLHGLMSGCG